MSSRPACPEGASWLSPCLTVIDVESTIAFYEKVYGFKTKMSVPDENGKAKFAEMTYKNHLLMLSAEGAYGNPAKAPTTSNAISPMSLYLYCEDVDAFYSHAVANGAESIEAPTDMFWGDRMCRLRGLDGYVWVFATNVADFDPSTVPA